VLNGDIVDLHLQQIEDVAVEHQLDLRVVSHLAVVVLEQLGDALLFLTGISWGLFTLFARVWNVRPLQATTIISVLSMIYLPLYFAFFYRGFATASTTHILLQVGYQGLGMSIAALYLVTFAVRRLGAQLTSLFSPLIPVMTTMMAVPLLGEVPTPSQWVGVALVAIGMVTDWRLSS
jgi:drug/metabolite transporter (DMT)-like permease